MDWNLPVTDFVGTTGSAWRIPVCLLVLTDSGFTLAGRACLGCARTAEREAAKRTHLKRRFVNILGKFS